MVSNNNNKKVRITFYLWYSMIMADVEKFDLFTGGIPKNLPIFKESSDEVKKRITLFRKVRTLFLSHIIA